MTRKVKFILVTGLLAGVLDGLAAMASYMIKGGKNPQVIFKFIASGILGKSAMSGGTEIVLLGVILHLCIALGWTILFFTFYERLKIFVLNWVVTGLLYGVIVWICMNGIVLPLSNVNPLTHSFASVFIGVSVLMVCIGLPVSYGAKKNFGHP